MTCIGTALQAGAGGSGAYSMMIIGRIICGLGLAVVSTSVPLYQRFVLIPTSCTAYAKPVITVKLRLRSNEDVM